MVSNNRSCWLELGGLVSYCRTQTVVSFALKVYPVTDENLRGLPIPGSALYADIKRTQAIRPGDSGDAGNLPDLQTREFVDSLLMFG